MSRFRSLFLSFGCALLLIPRLVCAQNAPAPSPILAPDALFITPVGGLENTASSAAKVPVAGQDFKDALRVSIGKASAETNATQLTMPNAAPLFKGEVALLSFSVRGQNAQKKPAHIEFLFEKATEPWTKSAVLDVTTDPDATRWKRVVFPFAISQNFAPAEAMASIRLAFGPQTVEIGGLTLLSYGKTKTVTQLLEVAAAQSPIGRVAVTVDLQKGAQKLGGFGGNFPQPRYGKTEAMDAVGQFNLDHLPVAQARIGVPLEVWAPARGVFKDEGAAHAALAELQLLAARKIPIIASVWEGPQWLVGGEREASGKTLPRERYDDCIEIITRFLVTARDKYRAPVAYFSFNEADYGVNFKFTPAQIADFIALAGPLWKAAGLQTKFLVGDTASGIHAVDYARPLLENRAIAPYLGPIAFHCWDVLGATEESYRAIAALGAQFDKEIWCTEAGHDSALWEKENPWTSWDNALQTALAYAKTLNLSGASVLDYWTYQDNYPLVGADGKTPFPVWNVVQSFSRALPSGYRIVASQCDNPDLKTIAARGPKGEFSLVIINSAGAGEVQVNGLPANTRFTTQTLRNEAATATAQKMTNSQGAATFKLLPRVILVVTSVSVAR